MTKQKNKKQINNQQWKWKATGLMCVNMENGWVISVRASLPSKADICYTLG